MDKHFGNTIQHPQEWGAHYMEYLMQFVANPQEATGKVCLDDVWQKEDADYLCIQPSKAVEEPRFILGEQ